MAEDAEVQWADLVVVAAASEVAEEADLEAAVATVDHAVEAEGTSSYYFMLQMQVLTDV